jgi:hypothetical protein
MLGDRAERSTAIPTKCEDSDRGGDGVVGMLYDFSRSEDCSAVRCKERFCCIWETDVDGLERGDV